MRIHKCARCGCQFCYSDGRAPALDGEGQPICSYCATKEKIKETD